MNSRTPLILTPRSVSSSGGESSTVVTHTGTPKSTRTPGTRSLRAPSAQVNANKTGRVLRTQQTRPARVNTAVTASPRKASAPSKLISVLGGSLDNLPSTVSVRRKTSAPAKTLPERTPANTTVKKTSVTVTSRTRSASTSSSSSSGSPSQRMSKDHGGSSGSHGTKGASTSSSGKEGVKESSKGGKKTSASSAPPDMHPLPPLKEEHRPVKPPGPVKSSGPARPPGPSKPSGPAKKMDAKATKENVAPVRIPAPPHHTPEGGVVSPPDGATTAPAVFPEKSMLEKTVSDLVKNNECKKQEIAALKMEINRLKAARERESVSDEESTKASSPGTGMEGSRTGTKSSVGTGSGDSPGQLVTTMQTLSAENKLLRDRLLQLGVSLDSSPLSDQEKELLLSKVSTISQNGGEGPSSDRGEWDNKSTSSVSEVSVACLQDRIQQMEETHYCTNEELQATLQELDDFREQLSECQIEIQQLQEEKQVILESLTQQTEKLNESRSHNDTLKQMLIQQSENSQDLSQCEKTQRLMELLKSAQEDRELLQLKQDELEQQITTTKDAEERFHHNTQLIRDRMKVLESMVETANNEKKLVETQLAESQEAIKTMELENSRLTAAHDSAKEKITELEEAVISGEKSELADLLERVRQEKDLLEKENAALQQKTSAVACENDRLKDQISSLHDELMVARNNARSQLEDAGWRKAQLEQERHHLEEESEVLRATVEDLKLTCQHHLEDKRELKASLSESQKKLHEALEKMNDTQRSISEERSQFNKQVEEWEQFQSDLLMTVRVANDFKTEAQLDLERLTLENTVLRDRLKQLGQDLEKAKAVKVCSPVCNSSTSSLSSSTSSERRTIRNVSTPLSNGEPPILADRRNPRPLARGDSRVKSLIESIECATRQTRAGSRSSSASSLCSTSSESNNNNNNNKTSGPILKRADTEGVIRGSSTSPLKDAGNTLGTSGGPSPLRALQRNSFTEGLTQSSFSQNSCYTKPSTGSSNLSDNVKMSQLTDKNNSKISAINSGESNISKPLSILSNKLDHSMRRNSYGQITAVVDKKDPLSSLAQGGGSKRNALLKWCQNKTIGYRNVDITNFSSSWNDGLALCALLDTYIQDKINYKSLSPSNKKQNFELAITAAESVGVPNILDVSDMMTSERPNWQTVYNYVTSIYCHFET